MGEGLLICGFGGLEDDLRKGLVVVVVARAIAYVQASFFFSLTSWLLVVLVSKASKTLVD